MSEEADTLEAVVKGHLAAMLGISTSSYEKAQALCDEGLGSIRKGTGLKSKLVDKALEALGLSLPEQQEEKATDAKPESETAPAAGTDS